MACKSLSANGQIANNLVEDKVKTSYNYIPIKLLVQVFCVLHSGEFVFSWFFFCAHVWAYAASPQHEREKCI